MQEGISGYQVEGSWEEVVDHGDRISGVLHALGAGAHPRMSPEAYDDALSEWDTWRPRPDESFDGDLRERTAKQASVPKGEGERRGVSPTGDLARAAQALLAGPDQIPDGGATDLVARIATAGRHSIRAVDTSMRRLFRDAEEAIYLHVMTRTSPCYFDNRVVSANIEQAPGSDDGYRFEININSDRLKRQVSDRLDDPASEPRAA